MKQEAKFNKVWERRSEPPYVTKSWVDNDWAKGRTDWLTFLIRVKDRNIINQIQKVQNELTRFECIEIFPEEYFHITIKELAFLVKEKQHPDEITQEKLPTLIMSVQEKIRDFKPFEIELVNLNNFKSTVCVEGHDGEVINNINGTILAIDGVQKYKHDYPGFLPHLSVAQYKNKEDYEQLIEYLEYSRKKHIGPLIVDTFELVIAELPIKGRFPILMPLKTFHL
jgi:2'-5' RNA ligase